MRMSVLVQRPLRTGRSTFPSFENRTYRRSGREGEKAVHYAASAASSREFGAAVAGTWEESEEEEEKGTRTATAQAAEFDSEYEWDQAAQRFVAFLYPHHRVD